MIRLAVLREMDAEERVSWGYNVMLFQKIRIASCCALQNGPVKREATHGRADEMNISVYGHVISMSRRAEGLLYD